MDLERFLPEAFKKVPLHMDFDGQKRAERLFQAIILVFGAVGFIWGYICQQFSQTMYILIAGFILSCLLTLPPWPMFRKMSLVWLKPADTVESTADTQKIKKKK